MSYPTQTPHARAVIDALQDGLAPTKVGDGVAPQTSDGKIVAPCVVFHLVRGGSIFGSLAKPDVDAEMTFQTTAVGRSAAEARFWQDRTAVELRAATLLVEDRYLCRARQTSIGDVRRDDDVLPALFYSTALWRLFTFQSEPEPS